MREHLGPDLADDVVAAIRRYQNFLKHADRDPDDILDFDPSATEYLLLECALLYVEHVNSSPGLTPGINAFQSWFMVHHPELMKRLPELEALADLAKRMGIDKLPRPEFYRQSLESHQRSYGS